MHHDFKKNIIIIVLMLVSLLGVSSLFFSPKAAAEIKDKSTCDSYGGEWKGNKCIALDVYGVTEQDISKADEKEMFYVFKDQSRTTCPAGYRFSNDINAETGTSAHAGAQGNGQHAGTNEITQSGCIPSSLDSKKHEVFSLEDEIKKIKEQLESDTNPNKPVIREADYTLIRTQCASKDGTIEVRKCVREKMDALYKRLEEQQKNIDPGEKVKDDCAIDSGLGWLLCPGSSFLSTAVEMAYVFISENFLNINNKDIFVANNSPAFKAWENFRNIANVIFAIIFLFVVFSQVTNVGIGSYGVKKMLPRMVIYSILINISWYICVIAVDLSNILGVSIKSLLTGLKISSSGYIGIGENVTALLAGAAGAGAGIAAVATAAGISFGIVAVFLALLVALLGVFAVMFILTMRQAIVILLVAISPIALAMAILPNTDKFFDKWLKTLKAMLMVYPIIGAMVGASLLVTNILSTTAGDNLFLRILYSLVPLFAYIGSFSIVKKSLNAVDGLGNKLQGLVKGSTLGVAKVAGKTGIPQFADNKVADRMAAHRAKRTAAGKKNRLYDFGMKMKAFATEQEIIANSRDLEFKRAVAERASLSALRGMGDITKTSVSQEDLHYGGAAAKESDKLNREEIDRRAGVRSKIIMQADNGFEEAADQFKKAIESGNELEMKSTFKAVSKALGPGKRTVVMREVFEEIRSQQPEKFLSPEMQNLARYILADSGKDLADGDVPLNSMVVALSSGDSSKLKVEGTDNLKTLQDYSNDFTNWEKVSYEQFAKQSVDSVTNIKQTIKHYENTGKTAEWNSMMRSVYNTYNSQKLKGSMKKEIYTAYGDILKGNTPKVRPPITMEKNNN